jgi:dolichol-phosphate mannosyltransferase
MAKAGPGPDISVVIAAHNEVENIAPMRGAQQLLSPLGRYEIIFVEDGSTDARSTEYARPRTQPCVTYRSPATSATRRACAGLRDADGRAVIVMDADSSIRRLIPELVKHWQAGFKIVAAKRIWTTRRPHPFERLTSRLYYRVFDSLGDVRIEPGSANYLLMDKLVVDAINDSGPERLRGVVRWFRYSLTTVPYRPGSRKHGATKYSLRRSLELAVTGIASHSIRPLRAAIWLSLSFAVVGGLLIIYSIVSFLFVQHTAGAPGWASIMAAIAILGAVQLLVLAIIGEYVGRILRETRRRPRYVIAETEAAEGDKSDADRSAH